MVDIEPEQTPEELLVEGKCTLDDFFNSGQTVKTTTETMLYVLAVTNIARAKMELDKVKEKERQEKNLREVDDFLGKWFPIVLVIVLLILAPAVAAFLILNF